jgi:uncharacterized RmlC-like cupin family protein
MSDMGDAPRAVPQSALVEPPELQTPGMRRRQAFASDDRWVGYVRTDPGEWSGWHHHGEHDTYFYVVAGGIEFEYGAEHATARVGQGEFGHVPNHVVHRERTPPGPAGELVLVRIGKGPSVFNVEEPG